MLLEIDDWRTVGDIQYRFNKCFPNLNLKVFDVHEGREMQELPGTATVLEQVRRNHKPGILSIKSWFTKKQVESLLLHEFGLMAKVVAVQNSGEVETLDPSLSLHQLNELFQPVKAQQPAEVSSDQEEYPEGW